jgi:hypothetical protein
VATTPPGHPKPGIGPRQTGVVKQLDDELSRRAIEARRISLNGGTGEREWLNPQRADAVGVIAMDASPDLVWIKFIRDVRFAGGSVEYASGSQWRADPATASALILIGAAVRMPVQQP